MSCRRALWWDRVNNGSGKLWIAFLQCWLGGRLTFNFNFQDDSLLLPYKTTILYQYDDDDKKKVEIHCTVLSQCLSAHLFNQTSSVHKFFGVCHDKLENYLQKILRRKMRRGRAWQLFPCHFHEKYVVVTVVRVVCAEKGYFSQCWILRWSQGSRCGRQVQHSNNK